MTTDHEPPNHGITDEMVRVFSDAYYQPRGGIKGRPGLAVPYSDRIMDGLVAVRLMIRRSEEPSIGATRSDYP